MTCRQADRLMECVLDGNEGEGDAAELHEHLSHCHRCAVAWEAAGQVRSLMRDCEAPDPGEEYFQRVTVAIMARLRAAPKSEEAPVISAMRYGPLATRGGLTSFLFALSLLVGSMVPRGDSRAVPVGDGALAGPRLVPALAPAGAGAGESLYLPSARSHHAAKEDANRRITAYDRPPKMPSTRCIPPETDRSQACSRSASPPVR